MILFRNIFFIDGLGEGMRIERRKDRRGREESSPWNPTSGNGERGQVGSSQIAEPSGSSLRRSIDVNEVGGPAMQLARELFELEIAFR